MMFPGGGLWSRKGVWGCAALKTPFSGLSCHSQGSYFKQKSQFTRPPFEKIWKFKPLQPQFSPNFSSQAPKFGNFQLTSPQIWKFSAHKPPFSEANYVSSQAPHLGNPGHTPLPEKKLSAPPPRGCSSLICMGSNDCGGLLVLQYAWLVLKVISEFDLLTHREIALLVCHVT